MKTDYGYYITDTQYMRDNDLWSTYKTLEELKDFSKTYDILKQKGYLGSCTIYGPRGYVVQERWWFKDRTFDNLRDFRRYAYKG